FTVRTIRRMMMMQQTIVHPVLRVTLEAPASTKVTLTTPKGNAAFALADLTGGTATKFLDDQVSVERQDAPVRLTGRETADDYPAMAKAPNGTVWLASCEYTPGKPIIPERLQAGEFDTLVASGNGDQIRLVRFDGNIWHPAIDVTGDGLDVWRPTVAVDGKGDVVVAWSQPVEGDWEIFYRRYTPPAPNKGGTVGVWSEITRLTKEPGSDFHVVAATAADGVVWLAWQAWRKDNFDIMLAALAEGHPWKEPRSISSSKA